MTFAERHLVSYMHIQNTFIINNIITELEIRKRIAVNYYILVLIIVMYQ